MKPKKSSMSVAFHSSSAGYERNILSPHRKRSELNCTIAASSTPDDADEEDDILLHYEAAADDDAAFEKPRQDGDVGTRVSKESRPKREVRKHLRYFDEHSSEVIAKAVQVCIPSLRHVLHTSPPYIFQF